VGGITLRKPLGLRASSKHPGSAFAALTAAGITTSLPLVGAGLSRGVGGIRLVDSVGCPSGNVVMQFVPRRQSSYADWLRLFKKKFAFQTKLGRMAWGEGITEKYG
jgi:hypothetical protein